MIPRAPLIFFIIFALLTTGLWLSGQTSSSVGFAGEQATEVGQKRFNKQQWSKGKKSKLLQKSFPLKDWGKHYSSLGSKRSAIGESHWSGSKTFETKTKKYPKKELLISDWTEKLADLQKRAKISTDIEAKKIAETKLYGAMLQDPQQYEAMAEVLSLRDINRFQFRRNRSDSEVPIEKAGKGK